jgi:hypothetical protein
MTVARKPKPPKPGNTPASISVSPKSLVPPGDVTLTWNAGSDVVKPYSIRIDGPGVAKETAVMASGTMQFHCELTGIYQFNLINALGYNVAFCSVNAASGS